MCSKYNLFCIGPASQCIKSNAFQSNSKQQKTQIADEKNAVSSLHSDLAWPDVLKWLCLTVVNKRFIRFWFKKFTFTNVGPLRAFVEGKVGISASLWCHSCCIDLPLCDLNRSCLRHLNPFYVIFIFVGEVTMYIQKKTLQASEVSLIPMLEPRLESCVKVTCKITSNVAWRSSSWLWVYNEHSLYQLWADVREGVKYTLLTFKEPQSSKSYGHRWPKLEELIFLE